MVLILIIQYLNIQKEICPTLQQLTSIVIVNIEYLILLSIRIIIIINYVIHVQNYFMFVLLLLYCAIK